MIIKHLLAHKTLWLILAVFWTILIAILCLFKFDSLKSFNVVTQTDKYVHFTFHFFFTIFWSLYYNATNKLTRKRSYRIVLVSVVFGVAIEVAQHFFTKTRKADFMDVLSNTFGAILAIVVITYLVLDKRKT